MTFNVVILQGFFCCGFQIAGSDTGCHAHDGHFFCRPNSVFRFLNMITFYSQTHDCSHYYFVRYSTNSLCLVVPLDHCVTIFSPTTTNKIAHPCPCFDANCKRKFHWLQHGGRRGRIWHQRCGLEHQWKMILLQTARRCLCCLPVVVARSVAGNRDRTCLPRF